MSSARSCPNCQSPLAADWIFCAACGASVPLQSSAKTVGNPRPSPGAASPAMVIAGIVLTAAVGWVGYSALPTLVGRLVGGGTATPASPAPGGAAPAVGQSPPDAAPTGDELYHWFVPDDPKLIDPRFRTARQHANGVLVADVSLDSDPASPFTSLWLQLELGLSGSEDSARRGQTEWTKDIEAELKRDGHAYEPVQSADNEVLYVVRHRDDNRLMWLYGVHRYKSHLVVGKVNGRLGRVNGQTLSAEWQRLRDSSTRLLDRCMKGRSLAEVGLK